MAQSQQLSFTWDLGPGTDFSNVADLFHQLNTVVLLAIDAQNLDYQARANLVEAQRQAIQRAEEFGYAYDVVPDGPLAFPFLGVVARRGALQTILEAEGAPQVTVVNARYENPLKIDLSVNFPFLVRIVEIVRDWKADRIRKLAQANYRRDELASKALLRRELRAEITRRLDSIPTKDIIDLLSDDTMDGLLEFAASEPVLTTSGSADSTTD